jgi:hypothetical protein
LREPFPFDKEIGSYAQFSEYNYGELILLVSNKVEAGGSLIGSFASSTDVTSLSRETLVLTTDFQTSQSEHLGY